MQRFYKNVVHAIENIIIASRKRDFVFLIEQLTLYCSLLTSWIDPNFPTCGSRPKAKLLENLFGTSEFVKFLKNVVPAQTHIIL